MKKYVWIHHQIVINPSPIPHSKHYKIALKSIPPHTLFHAIKMRLNQVWKSRLIHHPLIFQTRTFRDYKNVFLLFFPLFFQYHLHKTNLIALETPSAFYIELFLPPPPLILFLLLLSMTRRKIPRKFSVQWGRLRVLMLNIYINWKKLFEMI